VVQLVERLPTKGEVLVQTPVLPKTLNENVYSTHSILLSEKQTSYTISTPISAYKLEKYLK
jgi:hypothetical protein